MDNRLLVIKDENHSANPDMGLVIPLSHYNLDGSLADIQSSEFPNGAIFVSKNFMSINQSFKSDEIFIINEYFESDDDDWKRNPRLQKHYTLGNKSERLERHLFIPILNIDLPDIATGFIDYPFDLPNNYFFIGDKENIYGPFKATKQDDSWLLSPLTTPSPLQLNTDYIAKIPLSELKKYNRLVTIKVKGSEKSFLRNLKDISAISFEQIDYISDVRLISYFTKNNFGKGKSYLLGKSEAQRLSQGIEEYVKENKALSNNERLERLKNLLSDFLDKSDYGHDIISEYLTDNREGSIYLNNYFEKNRDLLLKEKNAELEKNFVNKKNELNTEIKEIEKLVFSKKEELAHVNQRVEFEKKKAKERIEEIKKQSDEDAHQALLEKQKELTEENLKLEKSINEHKKTIDTFLSSHESIKEFNSLNKELDYLKRRKQEMETENRVIENAFITQKAMLESPQLPDKLAEISTLTTILRGDKKKNDIAPIIINDIQKSNISFEKDNRSDYINYLIQCFDTDGGRTFSFDEMANLVICTSQSLMTILAGPPGTGKTSTAIRLAKHFKLTDDDFRFNGTNFLNIAVGRAWVSGRDILGFYNSLKDTYQPARTGLYDFLKNEKNNDFLKLILLDEANLSSIEHYWSDFLGMCDPEGINRMIDTGIPNNNERHVNIGKNIRFIATINNDSTTERLSPRLIDRVPVITMDHNFNFSGIPSQFNNYDGAVDFSKLDECFNISSVDASFTQEEQNILNNIIETLAVPLKRTTSIRVSQRKINAMKRYCHIANEIEEMRTPPLDYAVSQHVLPLIEGYGSAFKDRLVDLEQKLSEYDFTISKTALNNIINHGDIFGDSYSFF
ncbi:AAA family ATPase [Xenorhabdus taiwanensis]|uniref:AAA family ATPase n=1 Tax=Xenorhabdus taiwanensis TaxID=3085177 RepID=A0ABM8JW31_9GAMM|nr:AAA family ATPase [Xenorhabdus sp. TCT-1]